MMSGAHIDLIKAGRTGSESVEHAEGSVAKFDKNFMDRRAGGRLTEETMQTVTHLTLNSAKHG
jgi:hypothetical protein